MVECEISVVECEISVVQKNQMISLVQLMIIDKFKCLICSYLACKSFHQYWEPSSKLKLLEGIYIHEEYMLSLSSFIDLLPS